MIGNIIFCFFPFIIGGESGTGRRKVMEYCLRNLLYFLRVYIRAAGAAQKQLWYHDAVLVSSCGFFYGRLSNANY